jgi:hypothetical protein
MGKETLEEVAERLVKETTLYGNQEATIGSSARSYFETELRCVLMGLKWREETILDWLDNQIEVGKDCDGDTRDFEMMKTYINNL